MTPKSLHFRPIRSLVAAFAALVAGFLLVDSQAAGAAQADLPAARVGAGATFETLQAGARIYRDVQVRSVNARTMMITHAEGLASVHLRELTPELQAAFGYDPGADASADAALEDAQRQLRERRPRVSTARKTASAAASPGSSPFDALLLSFSQEPEIQSLVDLRPRLVALGLNVRNQGPRPSCAVFAVVSVLEYQNAQLTGRAERFSEEYLLWATSKVLHRVTRVTAAPKAGEAGSSELIDPADEGFALAEVVTALRAYGVPPLDTMPYTGMRASDINPAPELIAAARSHRRVSIFEIPGRENSIRARNLIHALNAGVPVAAGLKWPQFRTIRSGYLSGQLPLAGAGHAVTIVGYQNKTGDVADTVFIFKNSWGARWGAAGYGYATYDYVVRNLEDTVILEVGSQGEGKGK